MGRKLQYRNEIAGQAEASNTYTKSTYTKPTRSARNSCLLYLSQSEL